MKVFTEVATSGMLSATSLLVQITYVLNIPLGMEEVLPLLVSVAFLLIADIDSPRGGLIHVPPQNLVSLSQSLPRQ
jgi:hypothetical protein